MVADGDAVIAVDALRWDALKSGLAQWVAGHHARHPDMLGVAEARLAEAEVRKNYGVTVLCVRRLADDPTQPRTVILPTASEVIQPDDKLLVFGVDKQIDAIAQDT